MQERRRLAAEARAAALEHQLKKLFSLQTPRDAPDTKHDNKQDTKQDNKKDNRPSRDAPATTPSRDTADTKPPRDAADKADSDSSPNQTGTGSNTDEHESSRGSKHHSNTSESGVISKGSSPEDPKKDPKTDSKGSYSPSQYSEILGLRKKLEMMIGEV